MVSRFQAISSDASSITAASNNVTQKAAQQITLAAPKPLLRTTANDIQEPTSTVPNLSPESSSSSQQLCELGVRGRWVQDWDYANRSQYATYPLNIKGFAGNEDWKRKRERIAQQRFGPTPEAPFRWDTSWRWQEEESQQECNDNKNVSLISKEGLCTLFQQMNITRLQVVGDSMSAQFSSSFLHLIGHGEATARDYWNKVVDIACPSSSTTISFLYTRVNEFFGTPEERKRLRSEFVQDNPQRTAVVWNFGAHLQDSESFRRNFTAAMDWIDSWNRRSQDDVVFFRDLSPGHINCSARGHPKSFQPTDRPEMVVPFQNYSEWAASGTMLLHNWKLLEAWNSYARKHLENRRGASTNKTHRQNTTTVRYLNIFNSTILRRDGHIWKNDCLHYNLGGPVDWWVHFWYSAMKNVARSEYNVEV